MVHIKHILKILWSKQAIGNVAYIGYYISDKDFLCISGNVVDTVELRQMSTGIWTDDCSCKSIKAASRTKGTMSPVKAEVNHYFPNLQYNAVVKHVDLSTVTSEWGVQSYYIRMGVPIQTADYPKLLNDYRLNTVEVVYPRGPVCYLNLLDKYCDNIVEKQELGHIVPLERGIGLMTDDNMMYAINTLLVLFEKEEQRVQFNADLKDKLNIALPLLPNRHLLFV